MSDRIQSRQEERANAITHGFGFLLGLCGVPALLTRASTGDAALAWPAAAVFLFGCLMSYLSSTLYHAVQQPVLKRQLRIWDHISIFFLIGGTYTPLIFRYTPSTTALLFLSCMWGIILAGCVLKIFFTGKYELVSTILYLVLGWMIVFVIPPIRANMPFEVFTWVLAGGLSYTFGVVFYRWQALSFHHAIWHLFVLAGTVLHFIAIYKSVGG